MPRHGSVAILTTNLHPREMERRWVDSEAGAAGLMVAIAAVLLAACGGGTTGGGGGTPTLNW